MLKPVFADCLKEKANNRTGPMTVRLADIADAARREFAPVAAAEARTLSGMVLGMGDYVVNAATYPSQVRAVEHAARILARGQDRMDTLPHLEMTGATDVFFIYKGIPGKTDIELYNLPETPANAENVGAALGRHIAGFAALFPPGEREGLFFAASTPAAEVRRDIARLLHGNSLTQVFGRQADRPARLLEEYLGRLAHRDSDIVHGDVYPGNVVMRGDDRRALSFAGMIDFECVREQLPEQHIAEFEMPRTLTEACLAGYSQTRGVEVGYRDLRMFQVFRATQNAAFHGAEYTEHWCRKEAREALEITDELQGRKKGKTRRTAGLRASAP